MISSYGYFTQQYGSSLSQNTETTVGSKNFVFNLSLEMQKQVHGSNLLQSSSCKDKKYEADNEVMALGMKK